MADKMLSRNVASNGHVSEARAVQTSKSCGSVNAAEMIYPVVAHNGHSQQQQTLPGLDLFVTLKDGSEGVIEAAMDTGAGANFITKLLVDKIRQNIPILETTTQTSMSNTFTESDFSNNSVFTVKNTVKLSFRAGANHQRFHLDFEVLDDAESLGVQVETDEDGQHHFLECPAENNRYDILLGSSFLMDKGIIFVAEEFKVYAPLEEDGGPVRLEKRPLFTSDEPPCFAGSYLSPAAPSVRSSQTGPGKGFKK